ncbi:hypothetical protein F0U59_22380 [Archangium gephyra]|nr:hypothetical protein F0U59_22380 [Archangium gephyra]
MGSDTSSPYSLSWNSRNSANGSHTLTARALDAEGNITTSAPVTVTTDNDLTPPSVTLTNPTEGAIISGIFTFAATATDDRGISKVEFYSSSILLCTDTSAPYTCDVNSRGLTNGARLLKARAYDTTNNSTLSTVNIVFDNDLTAPTTTLTSPTAGSVLSGTVLLEATANDERGTVSKVEFYLGSTLLGSATTAPFTFSWNSTSKANGAYTLRSRAYDPAGNSAYSATVSITVSN